MSLVAQIIPFILTNSYNKDETKFSSRSWRSVLHCEFIFVLIPYFVIVIFVVFVILQAHASCDVNLNKNPDKVMETMRNIHLIEFNMIYRSLHGISLKIQQAFNSTINAVKQIFHPGK